MLLQAQEDEMEEGMNCPYVNDGPCYHRGQNGTCTRKPCEECLKPYRDGVKRNEDAKFLRECAALFRLDDPNRAARLDEIAGRMK